MSDDPERYLIWSNEHGAWWGPGRCGYVRRLAEAGRYSRDEALTICAHAIPGDAERFGLLPELPVRLTDVLTMQAVHKARFPGAPEAWE